MSRYYPSYKIVIEVQEKRERISGVLTELGLTKWAKDILTEDMDPIREQARKVVDERIAKLQALRNQL